MSVGAVEPCPCGSGERFGSCCQVLHAGHRQAATAEELMRARYSAYAVGDLDYVWATWHPRTRPAALTPDRTLEWERLEVVATRDGGAGDDVGEVEFRAHFRHAGDDPRGGVLHERSRFTVRARRWFYLDGDLY